MIDVNFLQNKEDYDIIKKISYDGRNLSKLRTNQNETNFF